jgi:hypothetical protein
VDIGPRLFDFVVCFVASASLCPEVSEDAMRFLRDFYFDLPRRDRALVWVVIALSLAIGFGGPKIAAVWRQPADASIPAPPLDLRGSVRA